MFTTGKIKEWKEPPNNDAISKMLHGMLQEEVDLVEETLTMVCFSSHFHIFF